MAEQYLLFIRECTFLHDLVDLASNSPHIIPLESTILSAYIYNPKFVCLQVVSPLGIDKPNLSFYITQGPNTCSRNALVSRKLLVLRRTYLSQGSFSKEPRHHRRLERDQFCQHQVRERHFRPGGLQWRGKLHHSGMYGVNSDILLIDAYR